MSDEPAATTGTVVYLLGAQHSGSTIIETMLASSPDVFGLGQVGHFYTYTDFETCECGQRAAGCEPCRSIVEHVIEPAGVDRCRRLMKATRRETGIVAFLASAPVRRRYAALADAMFTDARRTTGATTLIDSSKNVCRAIALADASAHDVKCVHLVRDYRGFIRSRERRTGRTGHLVGFARLWKWIAKNYMAVLVGRYATTPVLTLNFEDLTKPETIRRLCEFCNIDAAPVVANMTDGRSVDRRHLFEPPRQLDYSTVTFSKDRALASLQTSHRDRWLEMFGGRLGRRWGYPRDADR